MKIGTEQIKPSKYRPDASQVPFYKPTLADHQMATEALRAILITPSEIRGEYELIQGEKSWRTAICIGQMEMEAQVLVSPTKDKEKQLFDQDFCATHPNPISRARLYQARIDAGESLSDIARSGGTHRANIKHAINLLDLPQAIQADLLSGKLGEGHARHLTGIPAPIQMLIWEEIKRDNLNVKKAWDRCRSEKAKMAGNPLLSYTLPEGIETPAKDPNIAQFERKLTEHFGHVVSIKQNPDNKGGHLVFEYFDNEGLDSILEHTDFIF